MFFLYIFAKIQNQNQISHYFPLKKKTSKNMKLSFPKVMPHLFVIAPSLFDLDFERADFFRSHLLEIYLALYNNSFFFSCYFVLILQEKNKTKELILHHFISFFVNFN